MFWKKTAGRSSKEKLFFLCFKENFLVSCSPAYWFWKVSGRFRETLW